MLTKQGLLDTLLGEVNRQLSDKGLYIKTGEVGIVDATVIEAKQSRPRKNAKGENTQDSEAGYNVKVAANEEDQHLRVGACQRRRLRQGHRLYPRQRTRFPFLEKTADPHRTPVVRRQGLLQRGTRPVHAGGDGLQHQARRGCPGRDDGVGRITPSNGRKTTDKSQGFMKNGEINAGFSQISPSRGLYLFEKTGI